MQAAHGCFAALLAAAISTANPAACAPKRIISTFLCTDEYVFRMVPRGDIAALSFEAADRHPVVSTIADDVRAAGVPTIRPSSETVLAREPDLVVMYAGTMPALRDQLARAHVPVLDVPWPSSLADVRKVTAMLGEKLDARARAAAMLAEMDRKIARVRAQAPSTPVRTLIYEANGYTGTGVLTNEMMSIAGLENIAPALKPTRLDTVPVETVLARAPELLILSGDPAAQRSRADLVPHHPALARLSSTAAWASLTPLLCPGPWSADAAQTFAALGARARTR
jgi:iron complex transport system substrate-binding protein